MILYDFEIEDFPHSRELNDTTERLLSELRIFLIQRFKVLAEDMAKEEEERGAFIVIYLLDRENLGSIGYHNYSEDLLKKLKSSITDEDVRYINLKLFENIGLFKN